ncbi:MAG: hypothetical protein P8I94_10135 [Emcibacteraceae bacterium]|nr:hypothetical protein [Emcibacteraceae bacterium]
MKIFIGHDSTQEINTRACTHSLNRFGFDPEWIDLKRMRKMGYTREEDGSTEFAYTRFLVPHLCGYKGYALFCDSDFIWRDNPKKLLDFAWQHAAVSCVPHPEMQVKTTKFRGNKNEYYPRKWWSSLMFFDCSHEDVVQNLTLENVNNMPASWLHRMEWTDTVGTLPKEFNHLVRYYDYNPDAVAVHFTEGTPMYKEYREDDYANEWLKFAGL